jgi:uncharacterized protein (TIGR03089 family)
VTWTALLAAALAADATRPLLTFYDDDTGERVELSVATYANWVAKTANLLVDGLGVGRGEVVGLVDVPRHWQGAVWAGATWTAGLVLAVGGGVDRVAAGEGGCGEVAVAVVGPDALTGHRPVLPPAREVLGLSLRPLGAPFADPLPAGVLDYAGEVAGYGDRFSGPPAGAGAPALLGPAGAAVPQDGLAPLARRLADRWGMRERGRLLVAGQLGVVDEVLACAVVPLALGGSAVLVRRPDPARLPARAEQERVTAAVPGS